MWLHENVTDIVLFIVFKIYIYFLVLSKRSIRSKERVRICEDYVISREIATVLKIAVFGKSC